MERWGILPDVSHLSQWGFYDLAAVAEGPIVASHSNAKALCNLNKIGCSVWVCIRKAIFIEKLLPLTYHTQNGIVHNKHFNRNII